MQNEKCKMQNYCIFFENDFNQSAKPTPLFCILHSAFCIRAVQLPDKHQFEFMKRIKYSIDYLQKCGMIRMYKYVWKYAFRADNVLIIKMYI